VPWLEVSGDEMMTLQGLVTLIDLATAGM